MKTLFFIIGLCILIGSVTAMTISPVRYNETVSAGSTVSFDISLTPNIPQEKIIQTITVTGDCANWVSMDTRPADLPASFHVSASIPNDATNGRHRCDISFIQPSSGMITGSIQYPITFNVEGGTAPTPAPVAPVITSTTTAPTAITTTSSVITTSATPTAQTTITQQAPITEPTEPGSIAAPVVLIGIGLIFAIIIIWDYKRGKK